MHTVDLKQEWEDYCKNELALAHSLFLKYAITLDTEQKHLGGERYLQQSLSTTSGRKLILTGKVNDTQAVIKMTREEDGKKEIEHERSCRQALLEADSDFNTPSEILYVSENNFTIVATEFIYQESAFLERPIDEQFNLLITSLTDQARITLAGLAEIHPLRNVLPVRDTQGYLAKFGEFKTYIEAEIPNAEVVQKNIAKGEGVLASHTTDIEACTGVLTHTDFVPHNIRVCDGKVYLLDLTSLIFGNTYEGWARLLNFMTLYNPALEQKLLTYVQEKGSTHTTSLRMMRIYRLGEIIAYYVKATAKSTGDLHTLNNSRILFWNTILGYILDNQSVPTNVIESYKNTRDSLRSEDEKRRQKGLH